MSSEVEGLHKMLVRKERNQEEALGRARVAEASLTTLQTTYKNESATNKARIKELEQGHAQADEVSSLVQAGPIVWQQLIEAPVSSLGCSFGKRPRASTRHWPGG